MGRPDTESAATAALGPGTGTTGRPSARASRTRRKPGSEIPGVPASETRATERPARSASRMRSPFHFSLCSKYDVVAVAMPWAWSRPRRPPRVLAGDERDLLQHAQRAQGDVLEVADGRRDHVERAGGASIAAG